MGIVCIAGPALAQQQGLAAIDTADLKKHLRFIASDELQGRCLDTSAEGLNRAADYIADNARRLGLQAGASGYFQAVDMVEQEVDPENFVEVVNSRGRSRYRSNAVVELSASAKTQLFADIPVVLAGFGENIAAADVQGQAVLVAAGTKEGFVHGRFRWNSRREKAKIDSLALLNPAIIFVVSCCRDEHNTIFKQLKMWRGRKRFLLEKKDVAEAVTAVLVLPEFADALLGGKGKYRKYLSRIAADNSSEVLPITGKSVRAKTGRLSTALDAKNVVAILPGADPELQNEYVVFMAHYDHLGLDENGEVYNGADDNGSGTVTIMEVAEAFVAAEERPKRSLVFLWVTGEEIGMLGSEYYTTNPVFPLDKTVACFNLDMVGRVFEVRDTVWNQSPKRVKDFDGLFTLSNALLPELAQINLKVCHQLQLVPDTTLPNSFLQLSDHYHFHKNGIPVMNYATGYHADYHEVGDEVEKINFMKMKRVAELCFLVGREVANRTDIELRSPEH